MYSPVKKSILASIALSLLTAFSTLAESPISQPVASPAKFCDLEVQGHRVIFIIDNSGSMLPDADLIKTQTLKTIATFPASAEFNIITVTDELHLLFPKPQSATTDTKKSAAALYAKLPGPGMQDDLLSPFQAAFQKAFAMKPDAIYFLTDGHFDPQLPGQIRILNSKNTVTVNTIALRNNEHTYKSILQNIAQANHGQYRFFSPKEAAVESSTATSPAPPALISTTPPCLILGSNPGAGAVHGPKVRFYGLTAPGKRIVYILDHSGSMLDNFDFLREETRRSVGRLVPTQQVNIIMVSDVTAKGFFDNLQPATPKIKEAVDQKIAALRVEGHQSDVPAPFHAAFEKAFAQKPDTIIFLTDGHLDPKLLPFIQKLNAKQSAHIHTIAFVTDEPSYEKQLETIAKENGGTYKLVTQKELGN